MNNEHEFSHLTTEVSEHR